MENKAMSPIVNIQLPSDGGCMHKGFTPNLCNLQVDFIRLKIAIKLPSYFRL